MAEPSSREEHVFLVRVWREPHGKGTPVRAVVEEVSSGHRLASTDLRDVEDFIRLRVGTD
ncbi:MAG: hypothetical protein JO043_00060 [Candidatus Eremiobacteraeota bacterium]|nr:hypothetical protein [Candidatus Eremiobacteraeota bacterium]